MRDERIDFLRFWGLVMIIFAHSEPPGILFQLRNFDVPLMVLVSGMSFGLSFNSEERFLTYFWKRIKRLVFPVWIFLSVYFVILSFLDPSSVDLKASTIVESYTLIDGIGYVWIIRVFILVAIVSPIIFKYSSNEKSDNNFLLNLLYLTLCYEFIRYLSLPYLSNPTVELISNFTHYIIPYSIVFALGLRLPALKLTTINILAFVFITTFLVICLMLYINGGHIVQTQDFKYPPSIYYFSYAIFVSIILWKLMGVFENVMIKLKMKGTVLFLAQNSIWVYLWHIPLIKYIEVGFMLKFLLTITIASLMAYIQVSLVYIIVKKIKNPVFQKNIRMMLTG